MADSDSSNSLGMSPTAIADMPLFEYEFEMNSDQPRSDTPVNDSPVNDSPVNDSPVNDYLPDQPRSSSDEFYKPSTGTESSTESSLISLDDEGYTVDEYVGEYEMAELGQPLVDLERQQPGSSHRLIRTNKHQMCVSCRMNRKKNRVTYTYFVCDTCHFPVCSTTHLRTRHNLMVQNGVELQPQPISMRTRQILARGEQLGYSGDEERARRSDTPSTEDMPSTEDTQSTSSGERDISHITCPIRRRRRLERPTSPVPSTSAVFSGLNLRMLRTSSGERDISHITSPPRRRRRLERPTSPVPSTSAGFSGLNLRMLRTPRSDSDSSE